MGAVIGPLLTETESRLENFTQLSWTHIRQLIVMVT